MYSSAIPLKGLTLKVVRQVYLHHQFKVYDNIIAYVWLAFVVIDMEAMINYLAARKSGMKKVTLTSCVVQNMPAAVLYSTLLDRIFCS